jgi:hypothetical protein
MGEDAAMRPLSPLFRPIMRAAAAHAAGALLEAGVRVFELGGERCLHAKTVTVDGIFSVVGSYNWDAWSHSRNLELTVAVVDRGLAEGLERGFEEDVQKCEEMTLERWRARPLSTRAAHWAAYWFVRACCSELLSKHTRTLRLGDETVGDETKDRGEEGAEDGGQGRAAREEGEGGVERG